MSKTFAHMEAGKNISSVVVNSSLKKAYRDFRKMKKEKKIAIKYEIGMI